VLVRADRVVTVLDGFHRLLKADLTGQEALAVKIVTEEQLGTIACTGAGRRSLPGRLAQ
jgi:hypothetical protein